MRPHPSPTAPPANRLARAAAEMHPGRWRYIATPADDGPRRFYEVHAAVFGIDHLPTMTLHKLQSKVANVIQKFGVGLLYDEASSVFRRATQTRRRPAHELDSMRGHRPANRGRVHLHPAGLPTVAETLRPGHAVPVRAMAARIAPPLVIEDQITGAEIELVAARMFPAVEPASRRWSRLVVKSARPDFRRSSC